MSFSTRLSVQRKPCTPGSYNVCNGAFLQAFCRGLSYGRHRLMSFRPRKRAAPLFVDVQQRVARLMKGRVLVGHRLWIFLSVSAIYLCIPFEITDRSLKGAWTFTSSTRHTRPRIISPAPEETQKSVPRQLADTCEHFHGKGSRPGL